MFLRRRTRTSARQVRVSLPRGHQIDVKLPKTPTMPWTRKPARSRWTRPQTIAGAATALAAAFAFLAGLIRRRGTTADEPAAALPTSPNGATTRPGTVTPAIQEPTSDREPDEIDKLARLEPTQTATSKRR